MLFAYYTTLIVFHSPTVGPDSSTAFYRSALKCPKPNCWYSNVAVGHNKLASTMKRLCEQGGLSGYRTNHSQQQLGCMIREWMSSLYVKRQVNHVEGMWKCKADCLLF